MASQCATDSVSTLLALVVTVPLFFPFFIPLPPHSALITLRSSSTLFTHLISPNLVACSKRKDVATPALPNSRPSFLPICDFTYSSASPARPLSNTPLPCPPSSSDQTTSRSTRAAALRSAS
ncbi:hypothetical protein BO82DRAFT_178927 [Aspergillus uvarum CBS 121591]|uniref:Uncharacterized protein n=1 Tax=Aspergillus uvarum CBS 121591 TaxID=1448315 RepID=A0A319DC18_9EURO|nr:hypothetical protein BO82DRAFT_178927 [Aspergillus uvarum CBS 121591]PYH77412.1 hypothetical protein BO82DRAFT_178927 [Aspergillus uvarum CBS 121591]